MKIDLMMIYIVGLKIYHRNLNTITETVQLNRYFEISQHIFGICVVNAPV